MSTWERLRAWPLAVAGTACLAMGMWAATSAAAEQTSEDPELTIGKAGFEELKAKGEIIESSPLYDALRPVIDPIIRAAQPHYKHPFKVYLVHESQPNAFATPGGYVYVVDALLYFVKNKEQLAGTLAHEVAHVIHHDGMTLLQKQEEIHQRELGAAILLGPTRARILAIALIGHLHSLSYSREAESAADITGADLCAAAGTNPWGLVWLFRDFKNARAGEIPQILSDHPNDQNRINALEQHFRTQPKVFSRFNPDARSATPFKVPEDAHIVFLR